MSQRNGGSLSSKLAAVGLTDDFKESAVSRKGHSSAVKAIQDAEEVEHMINDVLGSQLDESPSKFSSHLKENPQSPEELSFLDMVSITVVRAWELQEALGSTNPYIVIDWGPFGRSSTHSIASTTAPRYGSYLRFKSPFRVWSASKKNRGSDHGCINIAGQRCQLADVPIIVSAYSRNESVSDELLGSATVRRVELLRAMNHLQDSSVVAEDGSYHTQLVVPLRSTESQSAGFVELILSLDS